MEGQKIICEKSNLDGLDKTAAAVFVQVGQLPEKNGKGSRSLCEKQKNAQIGATKFSQYNELPAPPQPNAYCLGIHVFRHHAEYDVESSLENIPFAASR